MTEDRLTYGDLVLPYYTNTNAAIKLIATLHENEQDTRGTNTTVNMTIPDLAFAIEVAGLNSLWIADTGRGKTQLLSDLAWHHFNGDGEGGDCNWGDGRPNFDVAELFMKQTADLSTGKYDSDTARVLKKDRIQRLFFALDEINRAPRPRQNEFFDVADGKWSSVGVRHALGREGYSIFMGTANVNKMNGDFSGTYEFDRALLSRSHVTVDLDHPSFRPTALDELVIAKRKRNPKVDIAPARSIANKILAAHQKLMGPIPGVDQYFDIFRFIMGRGLDFCSKDTYAEKTLFPTLCPDCATEQEDKAVCYLVKAASERTVTSTTMLAKGLAAIAELKLQHEGKIASPDLVSFDPFQLCLQAYQFTGYHGNLNEPRLQHEYGARVQAMMNDIVGKLGGTMDTINSYMGEMLQGNNPSLLKFEGKSGTRWSENNAELREHFDQNGTTYEQVQLADALKEYGLGTDWVQTFVDNQDMYKE
ncbi:hypothetical protein ACFL0V_01435 [Nanoarchaeota archaeon]